MKRKILEISDNLKNGKITENEAKKEFLFLFGVSSSLLIFKELIAAFKSTHNLYVKSLKESSYYTHDITRVSGNNILLNKLKNLEV